MKRAIVATIAILMFACVLPMAQARQAAPNEVKDATPQEITTVKIEQRDQPSPDPLSRELKSLQKHLDQMMAQQKELQDQLRAWRKDATEMSVKQDYSQQPKTTRCPGPRVPAKAPRRDDEPAAGPAKAASCPGGRAAPR